MADTTKPKRSGLADLPAQTDDLGLGLGTVAEALADFISYCATPLTIGLQGDWGSGKTSLMHFIKARLPGAMKSSAANKRIDVGRFESIWFNTWAYSQFDRESQLSMALLMNLTRTLQRRVEEKKPEGGDSFRRNLKKFGRALFAVAANVASTATGGALDLGSVRDAFDDKDEAVDAATLFQTLRETFGALVADYLALSNANRLVIFIDDLDRLRPGTAIEVLEVLKNFLDVEGCVYVLAIDYDVVLQGLQERKGYSPGSQDGKSFFDKLIQVPFRMPTTVYRITEYVAARIEEAGLGGGEMTRFWLQGERGPNPNLDLLVRHSVGTNPRAIKRLVNLFTLQTLLARREVGVRRESAQDRRLLLPLTALQMVYHPVYQFLVRSAAAIDVALVALTDLGALPEAGRADDEALRAYWDERLADPRWHKAVGPRDADTVHAVLVRAADLRQRLVAEHYRPHQLYSVGVLAELTFRALDLDGSGVLDADERTFLASLFRVVDLVGEDSAAEEPVAARPQRKKSFTEHLAVAEKNGAGPLFRAAVEALRSCFDSRYCSTAVIGYNARMDGRNVSFLRLRPEESGAAQGVCFELYADRLAEYLHTDRGAVDGILPAEVAEAAWGEETTVSGHWRDEAAVRRFTDGLRALKAEAAALAPEGAPGLGAAVGDLPAAPAGAACLPESPLGELDLHALPEDGPPVAAPRMD